MANRSTAHRPPVVLFRGLTVLLLLVVAFSATADDRDLLRDSTGEPYMFIFMDTSGSMHWTPPCSEEDACLDIDPYDGKCTQECTMGADKCRRVCPNYGCVEYDFGGDPPRSIEIVVDNDDPEVTVTGNWPTGGIEPWVGQDYVHNNRSGQGTKTVRFDPTIEEDGTYNVYMFWSSNSSRATNVPIDVTHAGGTTTVVVDQTQGHGQYNYLGTFDFDAGGPASVLVRTDGTTGYVAVDALRLFSLIKPDPPPPCLRMGYRCQQELCPQGDCYAPLNGDDPTSKFFQAKQALYEVLSEAEDVHFGFVTYEQDNVRLKTKHWLYRPPTYKPESEGFSPGTPQDFFDPEAIDVFPVIGSGHVFGNGPPYDSNGDGDGWDCATNVNYPGSDNDPDGRAGLVGCFDFEPADLDNPWEMERARRIPKLGRTGDVATEVWYRDNTAGRTYRVTYEPVIGYEYGDQVLAVDMTVDRCSDSDCDSFDETAGPRRIYFELISDYAAWDFDLARAPMRQNGFFHGQRNVEATDTCNGWEPNDDTNGNVDPNLSNGDDDTWWDYTFKWPTIPDPRGGGTTDTFDVGDRVPLDWLATNRDRLRQRLAPNIVGGEPDPDFRTAVYWQDDHLPTSDPESATNRRLRLKDEAERPLLAIGSTPIAASLDDFRLWYAGSDSSSDLDGWAGTAAQSDIDWACRDKYVLFLTDGNETCGGDPCQAAEQLLLEGVRTFVVGFGIDDSQSDLGCIAFEGGTDVPILPRNQDELVEALRDILSQIKAEARSFASASIPAIQSAAADKIYLSSFIPLPSRSVWPGEIDVFRQPLPLDEQKRPDTTRKCLDPGGNRQSSCHLYEVGEILAEEQAPDDTELLQDPPDFRIGPTPAERRVFYPQANLTGKRPSDLVLFRTPRSDFTTGDFADLEDLGDVLLPADVMARYYDPDDGSVTAQDLEDGVENVLTEVLRKKDLGEAAEPGRTDYVMGDVFHANPVVLTAPNDFAYFTGDLCGKIQDGDVPNNCIDGVERGYRSFVQENVWRRRMLLAATNDGQLHFFDAGTRREVDTPFSNEPLEVLSDGSGRELFSYMPRLTMPIVREQAGGTNHIFSVDGSLTVKDVFIDPVDADGGATPAEREWRSVIVAGLREGGDVYLDADEVSDFVSGYYALDVTQPDRLVQRDDDRDPETGELNDPPRKSLIPIESANDLPSCLDFNYASDGHQKDPSGCDYPFPMELWTFTDTVLDGQHFLDEEDRDGVVLNPSAVGSRDLGQTWSRPVIGQIAVCEGSSPNCDPAAADNDLTTKHVAIFGGGLDSDYKDSPRRGTWLYMIDVETGKAIYKREVEGAVPASPTVLDRNRDGIFDVIYLGTTAGTLYKVDLTALDLNGEVPRLEAVNVRDHLVPAAVSSTPDPVEVTRVADDGAWDPFPIFTTNGGEIYNAPSAFFIPELEEYGLAFGTGDREDLWAGTTHGGRFYVIVDEGYTEDDLTASTATCDVRLPLTEDCIENIPWDQDPATVDMSSEELLGQDLLLDPNAERRGWAMTFPIGHRQANEPFLVSGVLIFSMFQPIVFIPDGTDTSGEDPVVCARTGITRSFVVQVRNANPVARLSGDQQSGDEDIDGTIIDGGDGGSSEPTGETSGALKARDRYHKIAEFTTAPFIDRTGSKNLPGEGGDGTSFNDLIDPDVAKGVQQAIMDGFPRGSRFNQALQIAIAALRNSTGVHVYATIPIAIYPADWAEE